MKKERFVIPFLFVMLFSLAQKKDVNVDYMLPGGVYAKSSIKDTLAPGGFGRSNNKAKKINKDFTEKGVFLKIDTTKIVSFADEYNGYKLYLVNKSDSIVSFLASDSRLSVIAEVLHKKKWKPIEYLSSSWCGNSYHDVYLKPNQYWRFKVPKFKGKIKAKLRYKLYLDKGYIYSNEIDVSVNKGQFLNKKKRKPQGIMDPYSD